MIDTPTRTERALKSPTRGERAKTCRWKKKERTRHRGHTARLKRYFHRKQSPAVLASPDGEQTQKIFFRPFRFVWGGAMEQNVRRYSVYMHEFPDGKVYVGMTSRKPSERWSGGYGYKGQPQIWRAIVEHGWKNIQHRIIETGLTKPEAEELEKILIKIHRANDPVYGYNLESGGLAAWDISDSTRQKYREAKTGENNPFYGLHLSENHKSKIRDTRKERDIQPVNKRKILCVETGVIYESTAEATRELGVHNFAIRRVCYGQRKTAGGYHWKYIDK